MVDATAGWTAADQQLYETVKDRPLVLVINKVDLAVAEQVHYPSLVTRVVTTVAAEQKGIEDLERAILEIAQTGLQAADMDVAINQRQAAALTEAKGSLEHVGVAIADQLPLDFWTIDLRGAIHALGEVTGEEATESVLERIFSRFCIGK